MGKRFVITFQNGSKVLNATSKAPSDVANFLSSDGYQRFDIATMGNDTKNMLCYYFSIIWQLLTEIERHSVVIIQYPVYSKKGMLVLKFARAWLRLFKRVRFIALVHDVRYLREEPLSEKDEIRELNRYTSIIVHSPKMGQILKLSGCKVPFSILGLFDYAVEQPNSIERQFSKEVCYAGNLVTSYFLKELPSVCKNGLSFNLYGRPACQTGDGCRYCGAFCSSDVSSLCGSWGLVWDGDSIDTLHTAAGSYQKVNSPHKASLYVVAEMPLIVNADAAIAEIVREQGIGICVSSLKDLDSAIASVDEVAYKTMLDNIHSQSFRLRNGENIKAAIGQLMEK